MSGNIEERKVKRKVSSDTDLNDQPSKLGKHGGSSSSGECATVSEILSETNSVLYKSDLHIDSFPAVFSPVSSASEKYSDIVRMAGKDSKVGKGNDSDLSSKMDMLLLSVNEIKKNQEGMKKTLEKKIDKLRNDLLENMNSKITALRNEITLDLGRETTRIDSVLNTIQSIQQRLENVENSGPATLGNDNVTQAASDVRKDPLNDCSVTVIATNIPFNEGEDILQKATNLLHQIGETVQHVTVTRAARLRSRDPEKPGLVKISFLSETEKVDVLSNKSNLRGTTDYNTVYLRSSKTHTERLIELNARTILSELPNGNTFRITANGRIVKRAPRNMDTDAHNSQPETN